VKAPAAHPRAVGLRADLDRYMTEIIIPERARNSAPAEGEATRVAALRSEWEALKLQWSSP